MDWANPGLYPACPAVAELAISTAVNLFESRLHSNASFAKPCLLSESEGLPDSQDFPTVLPLSLTPSLAFFDF